MGKEIDKLDRVFSYFIRIRDSDKDGYIQCCTCPKIVFWKDAHCCHFISRKHLATRFDEKNCQGGCCGCNTFNAERHIYQLGKYLNKKYGPGTDDLLLLKSKQVSKLGKFELTHLAIYYEQQIKELLKTKNFTL